MAEVAHVGEEHRNTVLVGGGNHFVITDRTARLDYAGHACSGGGQGEVSLPPKAPRGAFHHMDSSMVETLGAWAYRGWCPWPI